MAALTQTITPPPTIELFSALPGSLDVNNIYPRARVIFQPATQIALKLAANTNTVAWVLNLPVNYVYRIDTFIISLGISTSTEVSQFEDLGNVFVSIDGSAIAAMDLKSEGLTSQTTVAGGNKVWVLANSYSELFGVNGAAVITARLFDNDGVNETVAQNETTRFSFLQYDIQQVLDVRANAPQPVTVV